MIEPLSEAGRERLRRFHLLVGRLKILVGVAALGAMIWAVVLVVSKPFNSKSEVDMEGLANSTRIKPWSRDVRRQQSLMDASNPSQRMASQSSKSKGSALDSASTVATASAAPAPTSPPALTPPPSASEPSAPGVSLGSLLTAPPTPVQPTKQVSGIEDIDAKREPIGVALEKFFSARTVEAKLALVRDPQRVKPLMMDHYTREPMLTVRWSGLGRVQRVDEPGYRFGYVQALFEDSTPANVIVEETTDGRYLVDWEALVRYSEVTWADFQRMRPAEPKLLRLIASRPEFVPSASQLVPFASQWLELRHPAESGTVLGYFDRNDPKYAELLQQLNDGKWKDVPVTLRLCFPSVPTKLDIPGARIAGVEGKGWLILDGPTKTGAVQ